MTRKLRKNQGTCCKLAHMLRPLCQDFAQGWNFSVLWSSFTMCWAKTFGHSQARCSASLWIRQTAGLASLLVEFAAASFLLCFESTGF